MNTESDFRKDLERVMSNQEFNYKGKLIKRLIGGYEWGGLKFLSLDLLDKHWERIGKEIKIVK